MRKVLGAWLVFLVVAGPRMATLVERDAMILARLFFPAPRKQPLETAQVPGHGHSVGAPGTPERSSGSENAVRSRRLSVIEAPPAFLRDPLTFLSHAPTDSLQLLPGIGPVLADRIAGARAGDRQFRTWSDVLRVHGIGPKTIAKLQTLSQTTR